MDILEAESGIENSQCEDFVCLVYVRYNQEAIVVRIERTSERGRD